MFLSKYEEKVLSGYFGDKLAKLMKTLVKVGESLGARELVEVRHVHVSGVSIFNIGVSGAEFIRDLADSGLKFSVFTTANPYSVTYTDYLGREFGRELKELQDVVVSSLIKLGVNTFTCAPYYVRRPNKGEHLAWAESNAVLYANSLAGARTNREGGPLTLIAGILGRTYKAGVHLDENRQASVYAVIHRPSRVAEAAAAGYLLGVKVPTQVPYVRGLGGLPEEYLRAFLAAYGATSNSPLAVIEGITPDYERLGRKALEGGEKVGVDLSEVLSLLRKSAEEVTGRVLYVVGCPHLSTRELEYLVSRILGKLPEGVEMGNKELWLVTGTYVKVPKELEGKLSKRGVKVVRGACPVVSRLSALGVDYVITDSAKALHYLPKLAGVKVLLMDRGDLIKHFMGEVK